MINKISNTILQKIVYNLVRIRLVEEKIVHEYPKQEIRCPVHLNIGQEAISASLNIVFSKKDLVVSGHRAHGHYLGKGGNLKSFFCELLGKKNGCSGGRGGSMHLTDPKNGFIASTAIVSNSIPVGAGLALANKIKKKKNICLIFFGDGAIEEGVFYETINFAILKKLKVIFVCENNLYSVYTPLKSRQPENRKISNMVKNMGIKTFVSDGNNAVNVYKTYVKSKNYVNYYNKPVFIEFKTYRYLEHCGPFNDDQLKYRNKKEINFWKKKDPIKIIKKKFNKKLIKNYEKKINREIKNTYMQALKSKNPTLSDSFKKLYAK